MKIGDSVVVTNPGNRFTTNQGMFRKLGFKNLIKNDPDIEKGDILLVFGIENKFVGCYTSRGEEILIGVEGLSLSEKLYSRKLDFSTVNISSEYNAEITKEKIVVGCTVITPQTFVDILRGARKVGLLTDDILENLKVY